MRSYLGKLIGFAALQISALVIVAQTADPPLRHSAPGAAAEERLRESFRQQLFRQWQSDPDVLAHAVEQGWNDRNLSEASRVFQFGEDGYLASAIDKDLRLRTAPGRRLIILGGSNLAFGIDSQILADRYGVAPVNLGLHAALRANYLLRYTQAHVREGDVVVFCFEYKTMLEGAPDSSPMLRRELCGHLPSMGKYFADEASARDEVGWKSYGDKLALADFAAFSRDATQRFFQRATRMPRQLEAHGWASQEDLQRRFDTEFAAAFPAYRDLYRARLAENSMYLRSNFNQYGDYVGHYGVQSARPANRTSVKPVTDRDRVALERSIALLNRFAADYRSRGAQVFFAYSPLCEAPEEFARQYEKAIAAQIDVPILFPITAARTHLDEHYDSDEHLNWDGICHRMQAWTTALDQHLTPRVALSPAEHIALRDRAVRATLIARSLASTQHR